MFNYGNLEQQKQAAKAEYLAARERYYREYDPMRRVHDRNYCPECVNALENAKAKCMRLGVII